jgi:hypothetical protein
MEAAHQKVHDTVLPDFDFRRQNVVIGSANRVQSRTERYGDAQPIVVVCTSVLCTHSRGI